MNSNGYNSCLGHGDPGYPDTGYGVGYDVVLVRNPYLARIFSAITKIYPLALFPKDSGPH